MDNQVSEARCPAPTTAPPGYAEVSYIDSAPEKQVVLSDKVEYLARRVGGCQTDELLALLRRVMYELMVRAKR